MYAIFIIKKGKVLLSGKKLKKKNELPQQKVYLLLYLDPSTQKWEISAFTDENKARLIATELGTQGISKVYIYSDILDSHYVELMKGNFGHTNKEIMQMCVEEKIKIGNNVYGKTIYTKKGVNKMMVTMPFNELEELRQEN